MKFYLLAIWLNWQSISTCVDDGSVMWWQITMWNLIFVHCIMLYSQLYLWGTCLWYRSNDRIQKFLNSSNLRVLIVFIKFFSQITIMMETSSSKRLWYKVFKSIVTESGIYYWIEQESKIGTTSGICILHGIYPAI